MGVRSIGKLVASIFLFQKARTTTQVFYDEAESIFFIEVTMRAHGMDGLVHNPSLSNMWFNLFPLILWVSLFYFRVCVTISNLWLNFFGGAIWKGKKITKLIGTCVVNQRIKETCDFDPSRFSTLLFLQNMVDAYYPIFILCLASATRRAIFLGMILFKQESFTFQAILGGVFTQPLSL